MTEGGSAERDRHGADSVQEMAAKLTRIAIGSGHHAKKSVYLCLSGGVGKPLDTEQPSIERQPMHTQARTAPDEQTLTAYVGLATCAPLSWTTAEIIQRGPIELLAHLPADDARTARTTAARLLDRAHAQNIRAIVPGAPEWPQQIEDLTGTTQAPLCLWARGPLSLSAALERSIMVTGSRAATAYGTTVTSDLCYHLADDRNGWTIANLGAYGIDAAALTAAAVAPERVAPLVMLPSGLDRAYPSKHADMFDSIALTGVLASAYPPGTEPRKHHFSRTLTYLAALTTATVIVEAIPRSTCMAAARRAAAINRFVMAVPGPVTSEHSGGTHELIRSGVARLVTSAHDVVSRITPSVVEPVRARSRTLSGFAPPSPRPSTARTIAQPPGRLRRPCAAVRRASRRRHRRAALRTPAPRRIPLDARPEGIPCPSNPQARLTPTANRRHGQPRPTSRPVSG
jgi:DNA processing protein